MTFYQNCSDTRRFWNHMHLLLVTSRADILCTQLRPPLSQWCGRLERLNNIIIYSIENTRIFAIKTHAHNNILIWIPGGNKVQVPVRKHKRHRHLGLPGSRRGVLLQPAAPRDHQARLLRRPSWCLGRPPADWVWIVEPSLDRQEDFSFIIIFCWTRRLF